jgi:hypothetical protein
MFSAEERSIAAARLHLADVVASGLCIGCGACAVAAGASVEMGWERHGLL